MTHEPLVVAILTCHNRRTLTLHCLERFCAQNVRGVRLAVVVCDDGSTDGTAEAVRANFDDRVQLVEGDGHLYWAAGMALA